MFALRTLRPGRPTVTRLIALVAAPVAGLTAWLWLGSSDDSAFNRRCCRVGHRGHRIGARAAVGIAVLTRRTSAVGARRAITATLWAFRSGRAFRPRARLGRPGKGKERLDFGDDFGFGCHLSLRVKRSRRRLGHQMDQRNLFRHRVQRGRLLRLHLNHHGGFDLGPFRLFALVAQARHQIDELVQRHAGDRQHIRRRFKTDPAVLGAQNVRQPLQHINPDRPGARGVIARQGIMAARHFRQVRDRHQTWRRAFGKVLQPGPQAPQHQTQTGGGGLQQQRQEHRELAEPHAMLAQCSPRVLIQRLHVTRHIVALQYAHRLDQTEGKATGQTGQSLIPAHRGQGFKQGRNLAVDEMLGTPAHLVGHIGASFRIDENLDLRAQSLATLHHLADRRTAPHQPALGGVVHLGVRRVIKPVRPQVEFGFQRRKGHRAQRLRLFRRLGCVLLKPEPVQLAHEFATYRDFALVIHLGHEGLLLLQPPQQYAGAPVNKSLRQRQVEGIRQAVFYCTRLVTPMAFVLNPAFALRNIGPGANIGQTFRDGINVAARFVDPFYRLFEPIGGDTRLRQAPPGQEFKDSGQEGEVFMVRRPAKVRHPADIPQQAHPLRAGQLFHNLRQAHQMFQRKHVIRIAGPAEPRVKRRRLQTADQPVRAAKVQVRIPPHQLADRIEPMRLNRRDLLLVKRPRLTGHAKCAILGMPPGPPGNLANLLRVQGPHPAPVKLGGRGEGDMLDIEVQPHPDGIGRHQIIHIAILIHRDLRVARPRAQRPHHHRTAAFGAPDQLRNRIDIFNRKPDNRRPFRHPAYLFRTCEGQSRKPLLPLELHSGNKSRNRRAHGVRPQKHRLQQPPCMEQAVGEHMPPFRVSAKLDLIDHDNIGANFQRHRLGRGHPIQGTFRNDPLLPGHQSHHRRPAQLDHPVINLARQQA